MSLKRLPDATMVGWDGPFYPVSLDRLVRSLGPRAGGFCYADMVGLLNRGAVTFSGGEQHVRTARYEWYCALDFMPSGIKPAAVRPIVRLVLPLAQDWGRADGVQWDCSPAIYTQGGPTEDQVAQVIGQIVRSFS